MLTPKQEIMTRLTAGYIAGHHETPGPQVLVGLKAVAEEIIEYGKSDGPETVLSPTTALDGMEFGPRARAALLSIAKEEKVASTWDEVKEIPMNSFSLILDEEALAKLRNVGLGTLQEIKRAFGLCGLAVQARRVN